MQSLLFVTTAGTIWLSLLTTLKLQLTNCKSDKGILVMTFLSWRKILTWLLTSKARSKNRRWNSCWPRLIPSRLKPELIGVKWELMWPWTRRVSLLIQFGPWLQLKEGHFSRYLLSILNSTSMPGTMWVSSGPVANLPMAKLPSSSSRVWAISVMACQRKCSSCMIMSS